MLWYTSYNIYTKLKYLPAVLYIAAAKMSSVCATFKSRGGLVTKTLKDDDGTTCDRLYCIRQCSTGEGCLGFEFGLKNGNCICNKIVDEALVRNNSALEVWELM